MTAPNSTPIPGSGFDTGPLSWVFTEVRDALQRSHSLVEQALTQDAEANETTLRQARVCLHQAHGALLIVDVDGVSVLTGAIERLLDATLAGKPEPSPGIAQIYADACVAVTEFLEELLNGGPHQPVRLYPYYQSVRQACGERAHPSDLFFPNSAIRPQLPVDPDAGAVIDFASLRQRFERALLPFLRSTDDAGDLRAAADMAALVAEVERSQTTPDARRFWWVLRGFAEAVADGEIRTDLHVRQLFGRINLQLRRLADGTQLAVDRLVRDALFFIAAAPRLSGRAAQIRNAYQLDGQVPVGYERRRYGLVDSSLLVAARERLANVKTLWSRLSVGDSDAGPQFEAEMQALAEAGGRLQAPSLEKLLREMSGIARAAHSLSGESLAIEMAGGLLFVENALNHASRLSESFSEQAEALTARLLSVVAGEQPVGSAGWLNELSRDAEQKETVAVLAGEMRASLSQVEKGLEEFFGDCTHRAALPVVDSTLHQIEGALAILEQDAAHAAVVNAREAVKRFAALPEDQGAQAAEAERVARNLGALSFFLESLQKQPDGAGERFRFNPEAGTFEVAPPDRDRHAQFEVVVDPLPEAPAASDESASAIEGAAPAADAAAELTAAAMESPAADDAASEADAIPVLETTPEIDAELLDIFLGEAGEVLDCITSTLALLEMQPANVAHMTTVRRSFHTLKGSGRMVGLTALGEAAWNIEQVLNLRLADGMPADPPLLALLHAAATLLGKWVADLRDTGHSDCTPDALIAAATQVKDGGAFASIDDSTPAAPAGAAEPALEAAAGQPAAVESLAIEPPLPAFTSDEGGDASADAEPETADAGFSLEVEPTIESTDINFADAGIAASTNNESRGEAAEPDAVNSVSDSSPTAAPDTIGEDETAVAFDSAAAPERRADVIDLAVVRPVERRIDDNIKRVGTLEISLPLYNIYLAETDDLVRLLAHDFSEWRHEPERPVHTASVHAAHSLSGSSATVGFEAVHELAHALEMMLQSLARRPVQLLASDFLLLQQTVERIKAMLATFAQGDLPPAEPALVQALEGRLADFGMRPACGDDGVASDASHAKHAAEEKAAERSGTDAAQPVPPMPIDVSDESPTLAATGEDAQPQLEDQPSLDPLSAATIDSFAAEDSSAPSVDPSAPSAESSASVDSTAAAPSAPEQPAPDAEIVDGARHDGVPVNLVVNDELDPDLLPIFLEEGGDMLPQIGRELRGWHAAPAAPNHGSALLRLLHTIKGSARMAGAMTLGQHLHDMESRIEQLCSLGTPAREAIDELLNRFDLAQFMFDRLLNPQTAASDTPPSTGTAIAQSGSREVVDSIGVASDTATPAPVADVAGAVSAMPLVRVRADMLDRLVNQAGEVSIARSRAETEVGGLRQSLQDLTENVARLRAQLREIEIQAESQMASHMASSTEREFDPLEFDRFTRLQELTRMMAESVNDVASLQGSLARSLDNTDEALVTQARLTRDLQTDLMRVRMVQFASISERLYRVTRQVAKEVDKRVNLDLRGAAVEIDRGVLEKMAGPFEHLLRNAIVHGIETRAERIAAGKPEVGEISVEVRQEGNEVVIRFVDDGHGLDLDRIRSKALASGLLDADAQPAEAELRDLIFHPGFSTASEVTTLAGRGVGMDVVRSEAAALGGRIEVLSEAGRGAQFVIRLPLTLAVTQVVLLSTGGRTFALPSVLVEQVQQLKSGALASAYNDGAVWWQGQRIALHYLPTLLGDLDSVPVTQQYSPVIILRSGAERIAIHVDEVIGNREVVVKNIGPQLARLAGIAGATVLGSGDIVLILNPVPLAQRAASNMPRAPRLDTSDRSGEMGAVAELRKPATTDVEPVQGLRVQPVVMVVDDSLTVRRVTQRLLAREGYQVVLAKDGVDALQQLQAIVPDVMLLDIEMPRMDGFDLTRNVRSDERTRNLPIIMITSRTAAKHRSYAMELGVNEYLGKPYQETGLLALIQHYVAAGEPSEAQ